MNNEFLDDRRKALEEEFFRRREAALLARLRAEEEQRAARAALAEVSHITDDALLDQLMAYGINADTVIALSLVPLVEVAWADGKVEDSERRPILEAARADGMDETSVGYRLLENCLSERPQARVRSMWKEYIKSVCSTLSPEQRDRLKADLVRRARSVAEATGGFMDFGAKVSNKEEALLAEIGAAFHQ